jgi:hypothetical protein
MSELEIYLYEWLKKLYGEDKIDEFWWKQINIRTLEFISERSKQKK